jgi:hypothetical protein
VSSIGKHTFGQRIRAIRLGYRWLPELGVFLRIADEGGLRIDVRAPSALTARERLLEYFCWWEEEADRPLIIEVVRRHWRGEDHATWHVDEDGNPV